MAKKAAAALFSFHIFSCERKKLLIFFVRYDKINFGHVCTFFENCPRVGQNVQKKCEKRKELFL